MTTDLIYQQVSVVMSVRNGELWLDESIQSILNQTYKDFEFIIVNDGSTDNTGYVINKYSDERIRVINHKVPRGLTASLIEAIKVAKGSYIARMDADDISSKTRLERQFTYLQNHPQIGFLGSWYSVVDSRGRVLDTIRHVGTPETLGKRLVTSNCLVHGAVMFRKSLYNQVGGYRSFFECSQDYDLWLRMIEKAQIGIVPKVLYKWRLHNKSISINKRALQQKYSKIAQICYQQRSRGNIEIIVSKRKQDRNYVNNLLHVTNDDVSQAYLSWALASFYQDSYQDALSYALKASSTKRSNLTSGLVIILALVFMRLPKTVVTKLKRMYRSYFLR